MLSALRRCLSRVDSKDTEDQLFAKCRSAAQVFAAKSRDELTPQDIAQCKLANASARKLGYSNWQHAYWEIRRKATTEKVS